MFQCGLLTGVVMFLLMDDVSPKKTLHIGGFFCMSGPAWHGGYATLPAIKMALDIINNSTEILPDYIIELVWNDTQASPSHALRILFDFVYNKPTKLMLIGPNLSRTTVPVAEAASEWNLLQLSFSARSAELSDKPRFPYLFSTLPNDNIYNFPRLKFFEHFRWKRIALLFENHPAEIFSSTTEDFVSLWRRHNYTVVAKESLANVAASLERLKKQEARIIIGNFFFTSARTVFCEAFKQGMYGPKYAWFMLGWADAIWWKFPSPPTDCTNEEITIAQEGHFVMDLLANARGNQNVFGLDASDIEKFVKNVYSGFAFDAAITIALTLHAADQQGLDLENFSYDNVTEALELRQIMSNISFDGITGKVAFEPNRDRRGTCAIQQSIGNKLRLVASYNPFKKQLVLEADSPIVWIGDNIPLDGPIRTSQQIFNPEVAFIAFAIAAIVGIILAILFLGFNVKNRNLRYIKMSSPNMNNIIVFGCILAYIALVLNGLDGRLVSTYTHNVLCNVRIIILGFGFTLSFGAMFSKILRVHVLVSNKRPSKRIVKDIHLVYTIGIVLIVDIIFFTTWMIVDPMEIVVISFPEKIDPTDDDHIFQPFLPKCSSKHGVYWVVSVLFYKGLLLLFGLFLAWETRNIRLEALNDSRYIGLSVYNISIICLIGVPVGYIIDDTNSDAMYILSSMCIILCTTITLCLVFVPKIYGLFINPGGEVRGKIHPATIEASTSNMNLPKGTVDRIALQRRYETIIKEKDHKIKDLQDELQENKTK